MMDRNEKEGQEFKDDFVKDFIENGNRKILNENFESQVMQQIYSTVAHNKEVNSKLKWSTYFFYLGIFLIGGYTFSIIIRRSGLDNSANLVSILVLFFTIGLGISLMGNFKRFYNASVSEIDTGNLK